MINSRRFTWRSTMPRNRSRGGWSSKPSSKKRLDEALDRGDRRAELVRNVGHEVAADVFQPPQPRHVVQHDQHADLLPAGVMQGRAVGVQPRSFGLKKRRSPSSDFGLAWAFSINLSKSGLRSTS